MTRLLASRRDADDLQALFDGERPSSAAARDRLQPLASLATALAPSQVGPSTEFVAGLRERLVTEAADRVSAPVLPTQRGRRPHPIRRGVAAVAALALLGGAGAAVASTRAVPGDDLYGLKRGIEHVQLSLARGDVGRGSELLEQADARLGEAQTLAAGDRSTDPTTLRRLTATLDEMAATDAQAVTDLTHAYDVNGDPAVLSLLDRHLSAQRTGLNDLTSVLGPGVRGQASDLADELARLDAQVRALLGGTPVADAASALGTATLVDGAARRVAGAVRVGSAGGVGGTAGGGSTDVGGVLGTAVTSVTSGSTSGTGSAGSPSGAGGAVGSVAGGVSGVVGRLTGATAAATPTPAATSSPTSSALVTNTVGTLTSAVPLPSSSVVPSVSICVPVPPLTAC
ncbi:MAG TPA: DUF5667 domain-containing protein [Actinomycetes bacterium]|nr:DUF5667 domain-containing protein [Actinomycetes bacterium]